MPRTRSSSPSSSETRRRTATRSTRLADKARAKNRDRIRRMRAAKKAAALPLKQYTVALCNGESREYTATTTLIAADGVLAVVAGTTVLAYFASGAWESVDIREADPIEVPRRETIEEPEPDEEPVPA